MAQDTGSLRGMIDGHGRLEARLLRAMQSRSSARLRAQLFRDTAKLLDAIERYEAGTPEELRDQVCFFMGRAACAIAGDADDRNVEVALSLLRHSPLAAGVAARPKAKRRPKPGAGPAQALVDYIGGATERVSLIGSDYRYLATSRPNAAHYRRPLDSFAGAHIAEVIGGPRFETRARAHIDACLKGGVREYYYELGVVGRPRVFRCQMKPVRIAGAPRAVVYVRDVTDDLPAILSAQPM